MTAFYFVLSMIIGIMVGELLGFLIGKGKIKAATLRTIKIILIGICTLVFMMFFFSWKLNNIVVNQTESASVEISTEIIQ